MLHISIDKFRKVSAILLADVEIATHHHQSAPTDYTRRTLAKTLFTYLEGHLFSFKQAVLAFEEILAISPPSSTMKSRVNLFTVEERATLEEFTFDLSSGGRARKQTYYPRLTDSIKFTVDVFHRGVRLNNDVDFNCGGWNDLVAGQRIRNRLTHPKSPQCLCITEEELRVVDSGVRWYESITEHMLRRFESDSFFAPRFTRD
jgi:hypothetical protein